MCKLGGKMQGARNFAKWLASSCYFYVQRKDKFWNGLISSPPHKSSERISHSPHTFGLIPFQSHFHSSKRLTLGRQKGAMSRLLGVVCSPFFQKKGAVNIHFFMSNKFYLADHFSSRKITR